MPGYRRLILTQHSVLANNPSPTNATVRLRFLRRQSEQRHLRGDDNKKVSGRSGATESALKRSRNSTDGRRNTRRQRPPSPRCCFRWCAAPRERANPCNRSLRLLLSGHQCLSYHSMWPRWARTDREEVDLLSTQKTRQFVPWQERGRNDAMCSCPLTTFYVSMRYDSLEQNDCSHVEYRMRWSGKIFTPALWQMSYKYLD